MNPTPSPSLAANLRNELQRWAPFAQMAAEHVERFVVASTQAYYEPGEKVLAPDDGPVTQLLLVRSGSITGRQGPAESAGACHHEAGDVFPIDAALGARAVTATYRADSDTFCLQLPVAQMQNLAALSAPFADFLQRRVQQFLELSRRALRADYASQTLAEQSLETPLRDLLRGAPVGVAPATPLADALALMHERRIGSVLVQDDVPGGRALGILTRHDILGRVTLAQLPLATPIAQAMSEPVHTLAVTQTAQDAALLMSRYGIRHVPVTDADGRVVGIVSERDLFARQRLSIRQVSSTLRGASDVDTLRAAAQDIRRFAHNLLGQGVGARQLTELVSHQNDLLTERLVVLLASRHGVDLTRGCWLAFGSEGRSEQTIATDQDNGLALISSDPDADPDAEADRPRWLAFALEVNEALDRCGYPLCKGNVMASNPAWCLSTVQWQARFSDWIEHGAPEDLLHASIFFDLRALAGNAALAQPLRARVTEHAARNPRFVRQMAENALRNGPALNWHGAIATTQTADGRAVLDLKLHGSAVFVEAARLYALAHGIAATGTRARLEAATLALGAPAQEGQAWIVAFEFLQRLRLQVQLAPDLSAPVGAGNGNPNLLELASLNDIDRRMLKESLRVARRLQQRIELDYLRS